MSLNPSSRETVRNANIVKNESNDQNKCNQSDEIEPKISRLKMSESWPRLRRRSRQDRNQIKPKKQKTIQKISTGTTIIVIQKNEEINEVGDSTIMDNASEAEDNILKIAYDANNGNRAHWKSENRNGKTNQQNRSFCGNQTSTKGKPPMNSPKTNENKFELFKPKYSDLKQKSFKQNSIKLGQKSLSNNLSQSFHKTSAQEINSQRSQNPENKSTKSPRKLVQKQPIMHIMTKFEDLIQQKKEALGIKPLNSTLSNYKAVLSENEKLHKLVEEQK